MTEPAARIDEVARDLVVDKGFAPLEHALPAVGAAGGLFDACVARLDRDRAEVHAFLAWHGQDLGDLQARAAALRRALEAASAGLSQRVTATLFVVASTEAQMEEAAAALEGVREGHFLEKVLIARACVALGPCLLRRQGSVAPRPGADWFEERFASGSRHQAEEALALLGRRDSEEARSRRLLSRGETWATWGLIALNAGAYLAQHLVARSAAAAGGAEGADAALQLMGANSGALVFGKGEWWRLGASMFLHAGELHLLFNMVSLFSLGTLLERLSGPWKFLLLYLASGLAGSLLSAALNSGAASVGASGAIFGLAGALMALRVRRPRDFPLSLAQRIFGSLWRPVAVTLGLGLALAAWGGPLRFDNWAHIGGLFAGFGLVWLKPSLLQKPLRRSA